jgi:hypothetical protein
MNLGESAYFAVNICVFVCFDDRVYDGALEQARLS